VTLGLKRPSKAELAAAAGRLLSDVLKPGLDAVFCGINPGLYSAATGHHFARPGNRFWPALHAGGFTGRLLSPGEDRLLLGWGSGLTNLVGRATAGAAELSRAELIAGLAVLETKIRTFRPRWLAVLGIGAFRTAFQRPRASLGWQEGGFAGAGLWVLPNPSGLNAHHQPERLAAAFRALRRAMVSGSGAAAL
jgi:TDG/mug DNA glycosylase family protein